MQILSFLAKKCYYLPLKHRWKSTLSPNLCCSLPLKISLSYISLSLLGNLNKRLQHITKFIRPGACQEKVWSGRVGSKVWSRILQFPLSFSLWWSCPINIYHLKETEQNKNSGNLADLCDCSMTWEKGNLSDKTQTSQCVSLKASVISLQVLGTLLGQVLGSEMAISPFIS